MSEKKPGDSDLIPALAQVLYANGRCYRHVQGEPTYTITEIPNPDAPEETEPQYDDDLPPVAKLPPSSTEKPRKPPQHCSWCALHYGKTTCDCDWFEKEARS